MANLNPGVAMDSLALGPGLKFVPGTEFQVNNSAYTLLAGIVERASSQLFAALRGSHIFKPLRMTHAHCPLSSAWQFDTAS